mmetsp:Transcript_66154/g.191674  ORF Transcript_66154/g.191674 Transcript_66154/m.191674 type:complete len:200 (-) Transcript_66154:185-784(-)
MASACKPLGKLRRCGFAVARRRRKTRTRCVHRSENSRPCMPPNPRSSGSTACHSPCSTRMLSNPPTISPRTPSMVTPAMFPQTSLRGTTNMRGLWLVQRPPSRRCGRRGHRSHRQRRCWQPRRRGPCPRRCCDGDSGRGGHRRRVRRRRPHSCRLRRHRRRHHRHHRRRHRVCGCGCGRGRVGRGLRRTRGGDRSECCP